MSTVQKIYNNTCTEKIKKKNLIIHKMDVVVFDLDQTVVDSSHRTPFCDGKLDVVGYISLQTRENIYKDKILPLGFKMQNAFAQSYVVICTARIMTKDDYDFLQDNGLKFHEIYERGNVSPYIASLTDGEYKSKCLNKFKNIEYTFYDDSDEVIKTFQTYSNVKMIDAKIENKKLADVKS